MSRHLHTTAGSVKLAEVSYLRLPVTTFDGHIVGEANLPPGIFGMTPRSDLMHAYVKWQDDRRHAGEHKAQTRNDVSCTGKKMVRQKGSGGARHGSRSAPQFVGGGKAHGPVLGKSYTKLPKKKRRLAVAHALSARALDNSLLVLNSAEVDTHKTADLLRRLKSLSVSNALIVIGQEDYQELQLSARNLSNIDLLKVEGLNVWSILRRDNLIITVTALRALCDRYETEIDVEVKERPAWRPPAGGYARERTVHRIADHRARIRLQRETSFYQNKDHDHQPSQKTRDNHSSKFNTERSTWTYGVLRDYARSLHFATSAERIEVMKALRSTKGPEGPWREEMVRHLLPLMVSEDRETAFEAAKTLCSLRYNDKSFNIDHLAAIMDDEGVEFVTYVDPPVQTNASGRVRLLARLCRAIPISVDGMAVNLNVPEWLDQAQTYSVRVSGPTVQADSIVNLTKQTQEGDIMSEQVEFNLNETGEQEILVDFYADGRWLDRQTLNLQL